MARQVSNAVFVQSMRTTRSERRDHSVAFAKLVLREHYGSLNSSLFNKDVMSQAHILELG